MVSVSTSVWRWSTGTIYINGKLYKSEIAISLTVPWMRRILKCGEITILRDIIYVKML